MFLKKYGHMVQRKQSTAVTLCLALFFLDDYRKFDYKCGNRSFGVIVATVNINRPKTLIRLFFVRQYFYRKKKCVI